MADPRDRPAGSRARAEPTPDEFARTAVRSGLLTAADLAAVPPGIRQSGRAFADHLVAAEKLTHFQAEKLLRGRWQGFFLGPYVILAPIGAGVPPGVDAASHAPRSRQSGHDGAQRARLTAPPRKGPANRDFQGLYQGLRSRLRRRCDGALAPVLPIMERSYEPP